MKRAPHAACNVSLPRASGQSGLPSLWVVEAARSNVLHWSLMAIEPLGASVTPADIPASMVRRFNELAGQVHSPSGRALTALCELITMWEAHRSTGQQLAGWAVSWVDPAFVADPRIDHRDQRVQQLAAVLHEHERRGAHDPEPAVTCVACARRATLAVRTLSQ